VSTSSERSPDRDEDLSRSWGAKLACGTRIGIPRWLPEAPPAEGELPEAPPAEAPPAGRAELKNANLPGDAPVDDPVGELRCEGEPLDGAPS
jgi:hypothetical protein